MRTTQTRNPSLQREANLAALRNVAWHESGDMSEGEFRDAWDGWQSSPILTDEYLHLYREAVRRIEAAIQ